MPRLSKIRVRGEAKGEVERAKQGFRAGLDQRGQKDGELSYAKPADAAGEVVG